MGQTAGTKKYNAARKAQGRIGVERWLRLKARNWSNDEIARRCGVTESAVRQGLTRYYESHPIPGAEEVRAQETVKLDIRERRVTAALLEHIDDVEAHARFDRRLQEIAERRAKLLGLDIPVKSDPDLIVSTAATTAAATVAAVEARPVAPIIQIVLSSEAGADEEG